MKKHQVPHLHLGIDIGSTTIKIVLLQNGQLLHQRYVRHHADIRGTFERLIDEASKLFPHRRCQIAVTGSGGLSLANSLELEFVQEVIAGSHAVSRFYPDARVVIELGGEDAKITYLKPQTEQRMNGTCAGGTGSFIDQMATLLETDATGLNELAKHYETIYPIASRCGVFAKTDLQPLINEGAAHEDLAASVFQAVVNQTIAGLACGRPIRGEVVFLGGPLHFLSELRQAFIRTLADQVDAFHHPENSQLYVAIGAAMLAGSRCASSVMSLNRLLDRLRTMSPLDHEVSRMPALFRDEEDRQRFIHRHNRYTTDLFEISQTQGPCFLGIDAGSTTTKAILIDQKDRIVYTYYGGNQGDPIACVRQILNEIFQNLPTAAWIANACVTGYGEQLIQTAFDIPVGEIETMAHYRAAEFYQPGVSFILDIGGQDMKAMHLSNGVIDSIQVNEACSSGCGSFLQTFAQTLGMNIREFADAAMQAQNPVDLGTRCTVFMNSRVKQAQREGASVGDISAGLSYSVVRNALYKVIKIKNPEELGNKIVVQGGTFLNNAVLRCFELILGREVTRPGIAGLMGAFGAALIARERALPEFLEDNFSAMDSAAASLTQFRQHAAAKRPRHALISPSDLAGLTLNNTVERCRLCANHCQLTITEFSHGARHVSGNRCERGAGLGQSKQDLPNLYAEKYKRLFAYQSLPEAQAPLGVIGIPRVLNLFENYPLWFTFLTELGFSVRLSSPSSKSQFEKGLESIPSESACYPAKLSHGHIEDLIEKGCRTIFYPSVVWEKKEILAADNHFNCPIVTSYPEVIRNNVESLPTERINLIQPFLDLSDDRNSERLLADTFADLGIKRTEIRRAFALAQAEDKRFRAWIRARGEAVVRQLHEQNLTGIVLAGRPYHVDPGIHHGIPEMINQLGMAVLTEDSVSHLGKTQRPLRVVDQWSYHARLYQAADYVARKKNLELVQLTSFGCGLDAITSDQVAEILAQHGKLYTLLKIDEITNLGAARIRLRSLKVSLAERAERAAGPVTGQPKTSTRKAFTREMRQTHTILAPQMAPLQFDLIEAVFRRHNYNCRVLRDVTHADIEVGLKYVNQDACYPTLIVVGQLLRPFIEQTVDPDHTSILITQTGGGCRATNYTGLLRKAFRDAGFAQVPIIAISYQSFESNPGMTFPLKMLHQAMQAICLGDMLQQMSLRLRPYEASAGATDRLTREWLKSFRSFILDRGRVNGKRTTYRRLIRQCVSQFDQLALRAQSRVPQVGVVGEILVKYHPDANNQVIKVIEREGCEAVIPGLYDFFLYCFYSNVWDERHYRKSYLKAWLYRQVIRLMESYRKPIAKAFRRTGGKFRPAEPISKIAAQAEEILSLGNSSGEGWFLTGEMIGLIKRGAPNIICVQPFACLPNHVTGKGMIKALRNAYPQANIVAVDYDPGASEVNQLNRIKLMITSAILNHPESTDIGQQDAEQILSRSPLLDLGAVLGTDLVLGKQNVQQLSASTVELLSGSQLQGLCGCHQKNR